MMRKRLKIVANILFHIINLLLIAFCIVGYRDNSEELLLIVLSIFLYILSLASYIAPEFSHRVLYKWGEHVIKNSDAVIVYEEDAYKKYVKYRWLFLFFCYFFVLIDIFIAFI